MITCGYNTSKVYKKGFVFTILLLLIVVVVYLSGCAKTEQKSLEFFSDYTIDARFDPDNSTLYYIELVRIKNNGTDSTDELFFHLYGNLYKTENEGIEIISVADENDKTIPFVMKERDQLIQVKLGNKLVGGGTTTIVFTCTATIPVMEDRYGVSRDGEFQMSWFYPQLAVYDENGWNKKPMNKIGDGRYLAISDFMFTIEAPSDYEIVCNGNELSKDIENGQTKYIYNAEKRRELVFIAYTNYVHMERKVGNIRIIGCFNQRYEQSYMIRVMDAAAFAMEYFNSVYMEYPYETLIITNRAWATKREVSMEYSGLISIVPGDEVGDAMTTYHEVAHQWFYFIVGNDENAEPWLDESLAVFSELMCLEAADNEMSEVWWEVRELQSDNVDNSALNSAYDKTDNYTNLFYGKGAIFLKELVDIIGKDELLSILSEYCHTYAYKHATTQRFLELLRNKAPVEVEQVILNYFE